MHINNIIKIIDTKILFLKLQKLYWISNLLLGEKQVRASAPNLDSFLADSLADSGRNSGGTQWDALRASHLLASSKPFCAFREYLYDTARTHFIKNS